MQRGLLFRSILSGALGLWILMGVFTDSCFGLTLTGQVVDTQAQPIQDAEVAVCERYFVGKNFRFANVISPVVKTDAQGRFVFELDPALSEDVSRQRNIFLVARKAGLACAWEWLNGTLNTCDRRDFPLVLEPTGSLGGQVVDANGIPVKAAEVQALPLTYSGFSNHASRATGPKAWFAVTTDTQGRFRLDQLSVNANVWLRVSVPGSQNCYDYYKGSHKGYWVGESDCCLRLPRVGTITGQVRDDRGRPVPGVDLKVYSSFFPMDVMYKDRMTCSDAQGFFTLDAIPEGPHWIEVCEHSKDPDPWVGQGVAVLVKAGQTSQGTVVRVIHGGMFHVTVRDAQTGKPLEGMEIGVSNRLLGCHTKITDGQGRARIRALPGSYLISVGGDRINLLNTLKAVSSGQTVQVKALVNFATKVTGTVVDTQNRPVAQALVNIGNGDYVVTDADGQFSAYCGKNTPVKAIWIMARDREHDRAVLMYVTDLSRPVTLKLKPAWRLVGQVTDPQGQPVCAARVDLDSKAEDGSPRMDERVLTDRQGRFTLKAIPPRQRGFDYRLTINAAGYGPAQNRRFEIQGQEGEILDIGTFPLVPATESVSGCVVNAQGVPMAGAELFVNSVGSVVPQYANSTATDEQGRFRLTHLCQGEITISASYDTNISAGSDREPGARGSLKLKVPAENVKIVLGRDLTLMNESSN